MNTLLDLFQHVQAFCAWRSPVQTGAEDISIGKGGVCQMVTVQIHQRPMVLPCPSHYILLDGGIHDGRLQAPRCLKPGSTGLVESHGGAAFQVLAPRAFSFFDDRCVRTLSSIGGPSSKDVSSPSPKAGWHGSPGFVRRTARQMPTICNCMLHTMVKERICWSTCTIHW